MQASKREADKMASAGRDFQARRVAKHGGGGGDRRSERDNQ